MYSIAGSNLFFNPGSLDLPMTVGVVVDEGYVVVSILLFDEPVRLDPDALNCLHRQLGPAGAENVISRALEEVTARMVEAHRLHKAGSYEELAKVSRSLIAIGQQLGMTRFARVARDVMVCANRADSASLSATLSRLDRLAEGSLMAMWDLQDLRV